MSYSLSLTATNDPDLVNDAYVDAVNTCVSSFGPHQTDEQRDAMMEHLDRLGDVLPALAAVIGRPEDTLHVAITGHSNPNHAPAEGWSNETLTISISVAEAANE